MTHLIVDPYMIAGFLFLIFVSGWLVSPFLSPVIVAAKEGRMDGEDMLYASFLGCLLGPLYLFYVIFILESRKVREKKLELAEEELEEEERLHWKKIEAEEEDLRRAELKAKEQKRIQLANEEIARKEHLESEQEEMRRAELKAKELKRIQYAKEEIARKEHWHKLQQQAEADRERKNKKDEQEAKADRERKKREQEKAIRDFIENIESDIRNNCKTRAASFQRWLLSELAAWSHDAIELIRCHRHSLRKERKRLIKVSPYGKVDKRKWLQAGIPRFAHEVLLSPFLKSVYARYGVGCVSEIDVYKDEGWIFYEKALKQQMPDRIENRDLSTLNKIEIGSCVRREWLNCDPYGILAIPPKEWYLKNEHEEVVLIALGRWVAGVLEDVLSEAESADLSDATTGEEYEVFCSTLLGNAGWQVSATPTTGDQGVDIIASKSTRRVCIQCKRYSSQVGNSAVQEVTAGRLYWNGTHAAVVSNAGFTKSAQELADATGVYLLNHDDLADLDNILGPQ